LAMIWQGAFIDASRHRTDRGEGSEPPLGDHIIRLPEGEPFAVLESPDSPWPTAAGKKAGYQMRGYRLDQKRRPVFLYYFSSIQAEDCPSPVPGELDPEFHRTITLHAQATVSNLWFRAAVGSTIERSQTGLYNIDGKLTLRVGSSLRARATIRQRGEKA